MTILVRLSLYLIGSLSFDSLNRGSLLRQAPRSQHRGAPSPLKHTRIFIAPFRRHLNRCHRHMPVPQRGRCGGCRFILPKRQFTRATIATPVAAIAQMISARILGAIHADRLRRVAADGTNKRTHFHELLLSPLRRRLPADHCPASLGFRIGRLKILLLASCQIANIVAKAFACVEVAGNQSAQLVCRGTFPILCHPFE
jgi:hypothetical protein